VPPRPMAHVDLGTVSFGALALLTLGSAGVVAFARNIIHSAVALLGTFVGIAGMFVLLSADFLAATQVLDYVGGTLTLILFAVMLTARIEAVRDSNPTGRRAGAGVLVAVLLFALGKVAGDTLWEVNLVGAGAPGTSRVAQVQAQVPAQVPSTARLGHAFLGEYVLPFELASLVLLAAMVGAVVIARRAVKRSWEDRLEAK
jgi:NADH:ubiquinone oxidoreductase subunit 6 (subunit J)